MKNKFGEPLRFGDIRFYKPSTGVRAAKVLQEMIEKSLSRKLRVSEFQEMEVEPFKRKLEEFSFAEWHKVHNCGRKTYCEIREELGSFEIEIPEWKNLWRNADA